MRFHTEIRNWVRDHLLEIIYDPWYVFATDLLYFLACEHETGWIPHKVVKEVRGIPLPTPRNYTPHPLSPFTNNMRRSIKYGIMPPDLVFEETYRNIVAQGVDEKLAYFMDHVMQAFGDFFSAERSMKEMYMMLLYVAKMATVFHQHGTVDAPQMALTLMAEAIFKLGTKVPLHQAFAEMESFANLICLVYLQDKERNS